MEENSDGRRVDIVPGLKVKVGLSASCSCRSLNVRENSELPCFVERHVSGCNLVRRVVCLHSFHFRCRM
jgi:hypothetical protein